MQSSFCCFVFDMYCSSFWKSFLMLDILFIQNTVVQEIILIFGSSKSALFSESKPFWPWPFLVSLWKMTYLLSKLIQQKVNFQKWLTFQNQLLIPFRQAYFMETSFSTKYKTCWPKEGMHLAYFWKYSIIYVIWPDQFFLIPSHIPMTQNTTDALCALPSTLDITLTLPLCQDED